MLTLRSFLSTVMPESSLAARAGTAASSRAAAVRERVERVLMRSPPGGAKVGVIVRRRAATRLESEIGPTDVLIACAGIGKETSALNFRAEDIAAQVNVNLIGVANSIDAVLAGMRQRRSGHLVVLSSLASYRGLPMMAGYCASKAGVSALFESLRVELEPLGLHVTIICPGWIRTPLTTSIDVPQPYMMEVEFAVAQ